jgi:diaminopimelate epimerase
VRSPWRRLSMVPLRRTWWRCAGVGADGVLLLSRPGKTAVADALEATKGERAPFDVRMTVVNADGSVASMCGNGLRCVGMCVPRVRVAAAPPSHAN